MRGVSKQWLSTYEEAQADLNRFNPSGEGKDDMENVL